MSYIALYTLWMICLAVKHVTLAFNQIRAVISRVAFTDISISTIAITTGLGTKGDITKNSFPALIASAFVRFIRITMNTRWITDRNVTACPFIAVEALAYFRRRAYTINTTFAYSKTANRPGPAGLTITSIRCSTYTFYTWR